MNDRTDTKNTRFSRQHTAFFPTWTRVFVGVVAALCVMPGMGRAASGSVRAHPHQLGTLVASDGWSFDLLELLRLWALRLNCTSPYGEEPTAWLTEFNFCWNAQGIPDHLTRADRKELLSTLDRLEAHLAGNPGVIGPALYEQTLATIAEARFELNAPVPAPLPALVTPESAGGSDGGDQ